ncbi:hypothetical protein YTPLAS72_36390 [Nitrospira sp.]|nr:hypothetical protein YTPLAS72_36390 [Nitrospira sp.]
MGAASSALLKDYKAPDSTGAQVRTKGTIMDGNTLTFAIVIVALGVAGIAVYMKGK